jgi:hypothetical protein
MDLEIIGDTVGVEHGFQVRDHVACNLGVVPGQQAWAALAGSYKGVYLLGQESRIRRYHELIDDYIEGRRSERP